MPLPWVLEFNAPAIPDKTRRVAKQFGAPHRQREPRGAGRQGPARPDLLPRRGSAPEERQGLDHRPQPFPQMAKEISEELFQVFNPRKMTEADALEILGEDFPLTIGLDGEARRSAGLPFSAFFNA